MPRTRVLASYPTEAFMAFLRPLLEGQTDSVTLPMAPPAAAFSARGEIYAWRRAAEAEPAEAIRRGIPLDKLRMFTLKVDARGLTAANLQTSGSGARIREILQAQGITVPPEEGQEAALRAAVADSMRKLAELGIAPSPSGDSGGKAS